MMARDGLAWMRAWETRILRARVEALEAAAQTKPTAPNPRALAVEKLAQGVNLTRPEVATYLAVSIKKIQRMDSAGTLLRCPGLGVAVRYSARDVLRFASASAPKGA